MAYRNMDNLAKFQIQAQIQNLPQLLLALFGLKTKNNPYHSLPSHFIHTPYTVPL